MICAALHTSGHVRRCGAATAREVSCFRRSNAAGPLP